VRAKTAIFWATVTGVILSHLVQIALLLLALLFWTTHVGFKGGGDGWRAEDWGSLGFALLYLAFIAAPFVLTFWTLLDWRHRFKVDKLVYYPVGGAVGVPLAALMFILAGAAFGVSGSALSTPSLLPPLVGLSLILQGKVIPGLAAGLVMAALVREARPQPAAAAEATAP
jgi:hypothetical protein